MLIAKFSLISIFLCAFFIVVCSILNRIKIFPSTKGVLCFSMISIIGALSGDIHPYANLSYQLTFLALSFLIIRQTYVAYKRGFL